MTPELALILLNVIFAIFVVLGFLKGLKGIKKTGLRFVCFIVAVVLAAVITPVISKSIMKIVITYNGTQMSLNDVILSYISSIPQIQELLTASPTIQTLIENMPLMIGNVVVYVVLTYVLDILSWVIYLVLASVLIHDTKKLKTESGEVYKSGSKKFRLLGGLLGACQGLILAFLTFLPISGAVGMVIDLSQTAVVAEETTQTEAQSPTSKLITENIPKDVMDYFTAYSNSALSKVSGVFGLDDACFNRISSVNVDGTKLYLRDEIVNISKVYDNVSFLLEIDIQGFGTLENLDFDKLLNATNYLFNSNILKKALPELATYGFNKILATPDVVNNQSYVDLINSIKSELLTDDTVANLKNEVVAIIDSAKIITKSGISKQIADITTDSSNTAKSISSIVEILDANSKEVLNQLVETMFESKILNKGVVFALNYGIDQLEEELTHISGKEITIGRLNIKDNNVVVKKQDFKTLSSAVLNIYTETKDIDLNELKLDYRKILENDLSAIIYNVGTIFGTVQKMTIFSASNIYDDILSGLNATKYNEYIDFEVLTNDNIWSKETENLTKVVEKIKSSNVLNNIEKNENGGYFVSTQDIENILKNLARIEIVNGQSKTVIRQIVEPFLNSEAIEKILGIGFDKLSDIIDNFGKTIGDKVELGKLNYKDIKTETEQDELLSFIDNVVIYASTLKIDSVKSDPFIEILKSNLAQLGSALDSVKSSSLCADYTENNAKVKGVYTNLCEALQNTKYSQYVNFNSFMESDFSWNSELAKVNDLINELFTKQITVDITQQSLIEYILSGGDWETIFKQIDKTDLTNIFTPLMKSKIFEPIGTMVVNKINEQIKDVVGTYGDVITTIIGNLDENQIQEVVEVLGSVTDIIDDITESDFTISGLATGENKEALANLMDTLQNNANNEGVFTPAYNALIDYIKADATIGTEVSTLMNGYEEGQVNWLEIINSLQK